MKKKKDKTKSKPLPMHVDSVHSEVEEATGAHDITEDNIEVGSNSDQSDLRELVYYGDVVSLDDKMDLADTNADASKTKTIPKKRKKGIIYISNIPKHLNVTLIREFLGACGKIGRVYLQPEKKLGDDKKAKKSKRKKYNIHFTEGWVEFESKRVAKQVVPLLNNKQISTSKKSRFYDSLWSMKYLPRFKWVHLTERMNYEQAVHKQRLQTEVSQARKETTFFQNNLDMSEHLKKVAKQAKKMKKSAQPDA